MRLLVHLLSADAKAPCDMTCHASVCDLNVCYNVGMSVSNVLSHYHIGACKSFTC